MPATNPDPARTRDDLLAELRSLIGELFLVESPAVLDENSSLLAAGILDSTGVLELVMEIESRYGFEMEDTEIIPDNLDSLANLARFVVSRSAGASR